jgi:hypothetical protein
MAIPERLRDPVALAGTAVFTIAGVVVSAWFGRMPWVWAVVIGVVIGAVVLTFSTWRRPAPRGTSPGEGEADVATRVGQWARNPVDDPRDNAYQAVALAGDVVNLNRQCEIQISLEEDDKERETADRDRFAVVNRVNQQTRSAPTQRAEWDALVRDLRDAKGDLESILDRLRRKD